MNSPGVHPRNLFESSVVSHLPVFPIVFCFDRCTEQELHEFSSRDLLLRHRFWRISRFCLRSGTHRYHKADDNLIVRPKDWLCLAMFCMQ